MNGATWGLLATFLLLAACADRAAERTSLASCPAPSFQDAPSAPFTWVKPVKFASPPAPVELTMGAGGTEVAKADGSYVSPSYVTARGISAGVDSGYLAGGKGQYKTAAVPVEPAKAKGGSD